MTKFEGFEAPNTTPVPDIVFDKLLGELTGNELKVLLYIIRRTYGFGKSADAISLSQFREGITTKKDEKVLDKGCGIKHNRTILVALASLEKKGYVIANKRQTTIGDADTTIYKLRFKESAKAVSSDRVVTSGNHVVTPSNDGSLSQVTTGSYPTSRRVVTSGNPQETVLQQTDTQETDLQDESNSDDTTKHTFVSSDTAHAEYPLITFADCLTYLQEQGVAPRGEDAVEIMVQARILYAHKHPRYEYRARPGLSEHPDDQLPGKTEAFIEKLREWRIEDEQALPSQDEEMFTDEEPQGDDHAVPASGHSHRVDDTAACGNDTSHAAVDSGQVAPPENRPVLETGQEITEGEHHASRVPALPATNHPASRERAVSRPSSEHSDHGTHPDNGLSAVRAMGIGTPGKDAAQTLAETPTTPMPAQSLSLPPQAEQAALGLTFVEARDYLRSLGYFLEPTPAMNGNWEIREPGERGFSVICGDEVRGIAEYQHKKHVDQNRGVTAFQEPVKPNENADQKAAKWNAQAMVKRAEELRGRQFSENARPKEVNAAGKLFKRKADLTQEEFEKAWKLWDTQWWHDNNGLFSITDLAAVPKNKSEMRLVIALEKLERAKPSLFSVPTKQSTFVPRQSKIEVPDDFIQSAYSYR